MSLKETASEMSWNWADEAEREEVGPLGREVYLGNVSKLGIWKQGAIWPVWFIGEKYKTSDGKIAWERSAADKVMNMAYHLADDT